MYLKQLDIVGFKSFADKTRLTFEPGMIAIVGPNGCGKSNVSDAIRWVLGEQRPTALRCTKLVDVVFNGTDTRKPLGICEVSITFADCEQELGTEYHEVTVTRRVYRDGTGEYFINKVKCGLKDVKRLFMGTGIGTTSYSVMAQGQIDQILSSKPEDRRAVFEEAAGITKFKADRKEALRKIESTEQNLLREADVLREMKRQIGSLQRQVGKAKRYKELRDELRGLDVCLSKLRIHGYDEQLEANARQRAEMDEAIAEGVRIVEEAENSSRSFHEAIHAIEEKLATLATAAAAADAAYARAGEMIAVNTQRIEEYRSFAERDGREILDTKRMLEEVGMQLESLAQKTALLERGVETAKAELETAQAEFDASVQRIDALRLALRNARVESSLADRKATETRDEIARLEYAAREAILKKERLAAEDAQLKVNVDAAEQVLAEVTTRLEAARKAEQEAEARTLVADEALQKLRTEIENAREHLGEMQTSLAGEEARLEMLKEGCAAKGVLEYVFTSDAGDVRIVAKQNDQKGVVVREGDRLVDHLALEAEDLETADRLLGDVMLAGGEQGVWHPSTTVESTSGRLSPITESERRIVELKEKISVARETLATGAEKTKEFQERLREAQAVLAESRRRAAEAQGEYTSVERDAAQLRVRYETIGAELKSVQAASADDEVKREELKSALAEFISKRDELMNSTAGIQDELQELEIANTEDSRRLTEKRVTAGQMESELGFISQQREDVERRGAELRRTVEGRTAGIRGYEDSIRRLTEETSEMQASLQPLKDKSADIHVQMDDERAQRAAIQDKLSAADVATADKRRQLEQAREVRSRTEVASAEATMRRQNVFEHLNAEYGLDPQQVMREPDPEWKNGEMPPQSEIESRVNWLNSEIAALGPVNMVAIDEFRELEERYAREKAQEADLLAAKERIRELITDLNGKSGELFKATFEKANENFQRMFTKLFNGGEARLVLLENEEDPLECGIDIIARPPGKRPQSVTLLSGGERTMTAVALLFAIFRIKPAPFTMLDELDAALDDANIGRFVDALKEFLDRSQFLIITHNQHTIAGSDLVYGVSQQEKGVSRIISMKLSDLKPQK